MGAWSTDLFGGDIARDVRENYVAYLTMGQAGRAATKQILADYADELTDPQDGPVVWLALAVTQWTYGRLEPRVKAKALKVITGGADLACWDPEDQPRRRRVLKRVRLQIESPPPPEKPVRVRKPAEPLTRIERHWKPGQVVAVRRDSGRLVLFVTEGVERHPYAGEIPYLVLPNWEGAELPSPARILRIRATRYVIGVYPTRKGPPVPWERVQRLDVTRALTGLVQVDRHGVFGESDEGRWDELEACLVGAFDEFPVRRAGRTPRDR